MKSTSFTFVTLPLIALLVAGCSLFNRSGDPESTVIGEVGGDPVTFAELRSSFYSAPIQDDDDPEATKEELREFLDLYLDYRAKKRAAKDAGYYEMDEIQNELRQYQMQTVFPYWLENRFRDELLTELVERSKEEIHTSHILVSVPENASPSDTLRAWNTLMEAREDYLNGDRDFEEVSEQYSTRQRGQSMGGDLGYISAGWAIKPFEDVAYATAPGEVSKPFRTSFGYHVVKVHDRRERSPDRKYSHIFFQSRGQNADLESALEKAGEVHTKLAEGGDWSEITRAYSEDPESRRNNGNIGWIEPARYQPIFVENISKIENPGDFSEPFESEYGVHIVRLDSVRTYRDEEHLREELYERLRNLPRYRENRTYTLTKVRESAGDSLYTEHFDAYVDIQMSNSDTPFDEIEVPSAVLELPMYRIGEQVHDVAHFHAFVKERVPHSTQGRFTYAMLDEYKDKMTEEIIIPVTKRQFPEFEELSGRYLDGLAVFKITEDSVWTYSMQDTLALKDLYENNKEDYWYGKRYRFYRMSADSDSTLNAAKDVIRGGVPIDSVRNEVSGLILRTDVINSLEDFPFDHLQGLYEGDFSGHFEYNNRQTVLYMAEIMEPRQMTFDEAFMKLVSDYQPIREQAWTRSLREKYQVQTHRDRLNRLLADIEL